LGENEVAEQKVTVKWLKTGEQQQISQTEISTYLAQHLGA